MYKIGVVGPLPSVARILDVANEFGHEIEFIPFPYEDAREVTNIIEIHRREVNGWFFSGPIPFMIAKEVLHPDSNFIYCPPTGANLYKSFLQMSHEQEQFANKVSIDMIHSEDLYLQESLLELGIPTDDIYVSTFDDQYDTRELVQFHLQLWREGKTQGALTCLHSVYRALQMEGMPVYRILMTKMEIRQAMKMLFEKAKSSYFKDTQIGVEIIEIDQFDQIAEKAKTRYHLQHLELKIKQTILHFCEKIDGSLMENGNGRYQIFSSRGAIEREVLALRQTVEQLADDTTLPVAVGIGFGGTAFLAETNARRAVQHSKELTKRGIVIVQENGLIIEAAGEEEQFTYSYRSNDKELLNKLNQANVSIKTYRKIESLINRRGWNGFTTADLAAHLSMTVRNAQRIMGSLSENGLAEYKGEELQSIRGRPRKIYTLKK